MSKMIKIAQCLDCTAFKMGRLCERLLFSKDKNYKVADETKILQNCPLEDCPEAVEINDGKKYENPELLGTK